MEDKFAFKPGKSAQPATDMKTARFIYEGWEDTPLSQKYHNDLELFESKIRYTPECPEIFRWISAIWFSSDVSPQNEPILEATYYTDSITPETIEKFFHKYKIHVRRASPFLIPAHNTIHINQKETIDYIKKIKKFL